MKSLRTNGVAYETILRDHWQTLEIFKLIFRCQSKPTNTRQRHKSRSKSQKSKQETKVWKTKEKVALDLSQVWEEATAETGKTRKTSNRNKTCLCLSKMGYHRTIWWHRNIINNLTTITICRSMSQGMTSSSRVLGMPSLLAKWRKSCQIRFIIRRLLTQCTINRTVSRSKQQTKIYFIFRLKKPRNIGKSVKTWKSKLINSRINSQIKRSW